MTRGLVKTLRTSGHDNVEWNQHDLLSKYSHRAMAVQLNRLENPFQTPTKPILQRLRTRPQNINLNNLRASKPPQQDYQLANQS